MAERVILDLTGGRFAVESVTTTKEGLLEDLLKQLTSNAEYVTPLLPSGTAFFRKNTKGFYYVIYRPAELVTTNWRGHVHTGEGTREANFSRINLLSPPRLFGVPFVGNLPLFQSTTEVFCTSTIQETLSHDTSCMIPWYPNTYSSPYAGICFGTGLSALEKDTQRKPSEVAARAVVEYLDNSTFNDHVLYFQDWIDVSKLSAVASNFEDGPNPTALWEQCGVPHRNTQIHMNLMYLLHRITHGLMTKHKGNVSAAGREMLAVLQEVYKGTKIPLSTMLTSLDSVITR